jgi:hypothetical protein
MSEFRHTVADFIRVSTKLLEAKDLSDDEEDSVRDILWQLCDKFPDEGDDAADWESLRSIYLHLSLFRLHLHQVCPDLCSKTPKHRMYSGEDPDMKPGCREIERQRKAERRRYWSRHVYDIRSVMGWSFRRDRRL